jgi:spore germination protein YaaH
MMLPRRFRKILLACCLALSCAISRAPAERLEFDEVWAYLLDGEERFLDASYPLTDIGYFGAGIDTFGRLSGVPHREKIDIPGKRLHLVVAEIGNYALAHFCLDPQYPLRDALVADIAEAARPFDGVQIDFEAVNSKDYENFYSFIVLLKEALGGKTLSVALPACIEEKYDRFGYERMGRIVDRVIVMAYDEHWSTSEPGPVASIEWCQKVSAYALSKIPAAKLVMGAPFYGRAWADKITSRAYKYSGLASLIEEKSIASIQRQGEIPFVEYVETVNVKAFFDDTASTLARLAMYRSASVGNIAFWRLGQEDPGIWEGIAASPTWVGPRRPAAQGGTPTP